MAVSIKENG